MQTPKFTELLNERDRLDKELSRLNKENSKMGGGYCPEIVDTQEQLDAVEKQLEEIYNGA